MPDDIATNLHPGFARAVELFGSQAKLARALGVTPSALMPWRRAGFSPRSAVRLERITDGRLRAVELAAVEENGNTG